MASTRTRLVFRVLLAALLIFLFFYVGRPLYWKISATLHDIRANKQTVFGGISQIVHDAKKSTGWFHYHGTISRGDDRKLAAARRLLDLHQIPNGMSLLF